MNKQKLADPELPSGMGEMNMSCLAWPLHRGVVCATSESRKARYLGPGGQRTTSIDTGGLNAYPIASMA